MNYKKLFKNVTISFISLFLLFAPYLIAFSANVINSDPTFGNNINSNPTGDGIIKNPLGDKNSDLLKFLTNLLSTLTKLVTIVAIIMIILSGLDFVLAQGNEDKIKKAKQRLLNVIIGTAIILGASLIANVIANTISGLSG